MVPTWRHIPKVAVDVSYFQLSGKYISAWMLFLNPKFLIILSIVVLTLFLFSIWVWYMFWGFWTVCINRIAEFKSLLHYVYWLAETSLLTESYLFSSTLWADGVHWVVQGPLSTMLPRRKTKKQSVFCLRMVPFCPQIWLMAVSTHHCTTVLVWSGPINCVTNCW